MVIRPTRRVLTRIGAFLKPEPTCTTRLTEAARADGLVSPVPTLARQHVRVLRPRGLALVTLRA